MGHTATQVAERRRTDPVTLRRLVTGDLNWIVLKAVEKTRQRRYPSVSELAADIRRHLVDQPVLACPPSRMYRVRKYVRRHRAGVLAAAGVAAALLFGFAATAWEASVAHRERTQALAHEGFGRRAQPGGHRGTGTRRAARPESATAGARGRAAEGPCRGSSDRRAYTRQLPAFRA
ncbi:hypothetical protein SBA3_150014 [Candidatus Sulfopaludibacter sp. SbA3]|nr:hypothetical protein SBA3_150014 [Candidatus Sulfopaludibacter sp. SbA3]